MVLAWIVNSGNLDAAQRNQGFQWYGTLITLHCINATAKALPKTHEKPKTGAERKKNLSNVSHNAIWSVYNLLPLTYKKIKNCRECRA